MQYLHFLHPFHHHYNHLPPLTFYMLRSHVTVSHTDLHSLPYKCTPTHKPPPLIVTHQTHPWFPSLTHSLSFPLCNITFPRHLAWLNLPSIHTKSSPYHNPLAAAFYPSIMLHTNNHLQMYTCLSASIPCTTYTLPSHLNKSDSTFSYSTNLGYSIHIHYMQHWLNYANSTLHVFNYHEIFNTHLRVTHSKWRY